MSINQLAGVIPALVFPVATLLQLGRMVALRSVAGVSATTWSLFGVANVAIYFYAERYTEWQAILGMLVTALLDFVIAGLAIFGFPSLLPRRAPNGVTRPNFTRPAHS